MRFREQSHEVWLDFFGSGVSRKAETLGKPLHMGIHHDAFGCAKSVAQDHVRSFAADPWQSNKRFHRLRDISAMAFEERLSTALQALGFRSKKAGWLHYGLQFR
jgi:hypothetical protein